MGGSLTPSPTPTHTHTQRQNFISKCPFSGELAVSQETPGGDAPSCQPSWQPLGGYGFLFCLETTTEDATARVPRGLYE